MARPEPSSYKLWLCARGKTTRTVRRAAIRTKECPVLSIPYRSVSLLTLHRQYKCIFSIPIITTTIRLDQQIPLADPL